MNQALTHLQGSVPPYPPPPPPVVIFAPGTLGRSIGLWPGRHLRSAQNRRRLWARLGTNLSYAPAVIGTGVATASVSRPVVDDEDSDGKSQTGHRTAVRGDGGRLVGFGGAMVAWR